VNAALVILAAADLGHAISQIAGGGDVSSAEFYSPIMKIATFVSTYFSILFVVRW
jgi:hypothetical protein